MKGGNQEQDDQSECKKEHQDQQGDNEHQSIQQLVEDKKIIAMLENIVLTGKGIDFRILERLNNSDTEKAVSF